MNSSFSCDHGTKVTGLTPPDAPLVAPGGCCSQGRVKLDHTCGGTTDDSATIYVKVYSETLNTTCESYTLSVGDE